MKNKVLEIFWTHDAQKDLNDILDYYKSQSSKAYQLVKDAIMKTVKKAAESPHIFEVDKFKNVTDENYRAFTVFHTRVTYQVKANKLYVLRLRHTSREPIGY